MPRLAPPHGRLASLALAVGLLVACGASTLRAPGPPASEAATHVTSNVRRADFAGSESCRPCHTDLYDRWQRAPMHRMTRDATPGQIRAPFDGRAFRLKDDSATLLERGGERFVRIDSHLGSETYLVTRVIGGHHREDFMGVKVASAEPGAARESVDRILPVSHMLATGELRYKGYSVLQPERPGLRAGPDWGRACIFCHNTAPLLETSLGWLGGPSTARAQGAVLDLLLPEGKQVWPTITDRRAWQAALGEEMAHAGFPARAGADDSAAAIRKDIRALAQRADATHLAELGIGCEACHNGSKEHTDDPSRHPTFVPRAPFLSVPLADDAPVAETRACGRCHQVLFSGYPFTWEGGSRRHDPGGSTINSGEARDMMLGGCQSQMTCRDCHDVHAEDGGAARVALVQTSAGNAICTRCHEPYASPAAVEAHTHHRAGGEGSVCVSCHMPRKNMSLDSALGRYHRIGSPDDPRKVERDRPLECALCHTDRTVRSLVTTMQTWWGKPHDDGALVALYGSLDALPLVETLTRGKPHEQAVAIHLLGQRRDRGSAAAIAVHLTHPLPILRYYARGALESILGEPCPLDVHADSATITAQARAWLGKHGIAAVAPPAASAPPPAPPDDDSLDPR